MQFSIFCIQKKFVKELLQMLQKCYKTPDPHKSVLIVTDLLKMLQKCYSRGGGYGILYTKYKKIHRPCQQISTSQKYKTNFHEVKIENLIFSKF